MALEQLDLAIGLLDGDPDGDGVPAENAVHETRKSLKRLRALIRLLAGELGEEEAARENAVLRDAGRRLAVTRDAEVLVATLDDLLARNPIELAHQPDVAALRARLDAEREAAAEAASGDTSTRAQVLADLRAARGRVTEWRLTDREGIEPVEPGLRRIYRQGRRRQRRAARGDGERARLMHMWRKRVKDLRYASEMLDRVDPAEGHGPAPGSRTTRWRKRRQRHGETKAIRRIARRADELGELLGDEHDLVLLATRVIGEDAGSTARPRAERLESLSSGPDAETAGGGDANLARADTESEDAAPAGASIGRVEAVGTADREATGAASEEMDPEGASVRAPGGADVANAGAAGTQIADSRAPCADEANAGVAGRGDSDAAATAASGANSRTDDGARRILLKLIEQRRRRLRKEALRRGERLYRRRPKTFISRTRDAYERAADG
jgi:hypothetical protein